MSSATAAFTDNKEASEAEAQEVKNLLSLKTQQSAETCPHRKTPVSQDIGTLFYDGNQLFFRFTVNYRGDKII